MCVCWGAGVGVWVQDRCKNPAPPMWGQGTPPPQGGGGTIAGGCRGGGRGLRLARYPAEVWVVGDVYAVDAGLALGASGDDVV